jgi:lincosamide nucleotidyltransferase A/C/D/E
MVGLVFPSDSFGEEPGLLDGIPVPVMSVAGMLAMKEQFVLGTT